MWVRTQLKHEKRGFICGRRERKKTWVAGRSEKSAARNVGQRVPEAPPPPRLRVFAEFAVSILVARLCYMDCEGRKQRGKTDGESRSI